MGELYSYSSFAIGRFSELVGDLESGGIEWLTSAGNICIP